VVLRVTFTASGQVLVQGIVHGLGHGLDEEARRVVRARRQPVVGPRAPAIVRVLGEIGEARTKLAPTGRIFVHGEHWGAEADGAVESGEKVRVIGYDGMRLKVTRVAEGGAKN